MRAQHAKTDRPLIVGTGLVALDVIVDETSNRVDVRAGGTCGNVLTILSYLGWRSVPLARFQRDDAYAVLVADLRRWGVDTHHLELGTPTPTPVIVELLDTQRHRFLLVCPQCGVHLPSHRAITLNDVDSLPDRIRDPNVFFFDRVSPAAIALAEQTHTNGGIVVCEPSSIGDERLLRRALAVTDILKISAERVAARAIADASAVPLVIETLGAGGVRYSAFGSAWTSLGAFPATSLRDSAGAGDWCTAGVLYRLASLGALRRERFRDATTLYDAISFGQALGAWTCAFVGPRGGMYEHTRDDFWSSVKKLLNRRIPRVRLPYATDSSAKGSQNVACTECDTYLADAARAKRRA